MAAQSQQIGEEQILHVIVGHGLPVMFLNAVSSFRAVCPASELLVVDNASPQEWLRQELGRRASSDPHMELVLRADNALDHKKVGALYRAYHEAFAIARERGFDYLHLVQADTQTMWWDADARRKLAELLRRHPNCVNVHTLALTRDRTLMGDVVRGSRGDVVVPRYGTTDTGFFHLRRWDELGMQFTGSEEETATRASRLGLETVVTPWPTEVPVPWPAVIRRGHQIGREVRTKKPFLCRPLDDAAVASIKTADYPVAWEDICVPWGWSCLSPMSETDLSKWSYFDYRRHAIRRSGWRIGIPRLVTAGLDRRLDVLIAPHRPLILPFLLRPLPSLVADLVHRALDRTRTSQAVRRQPSQAASRPPST